MDLRDVVLQDFPDSHSDQRRDIFDLYHQLRNPADIPPGHMSVKILKINSVMGNHYHEKKDETFYVHGHGELWVASVDEHPTPEGLRNDDITKIEIAPSMGLLHIPRRVAHAFRLEQGTLLIDYSTGMLPNHNPNDPSDNMAYRLMHS